MHLSHPSFLRTSFLWPCPCVKLHMWRFPSPSRPQTLHFPCVYGIALPTLRLDTLCGRFSMTGKVEAIAVRYWNYVHSNSFFLLLDRCPNPVDNMRSSVPVDNQGKTASHSQVRRFDVKTFAFLDPHTGHPSVEEVRLSHPHTLFRQYKSVHLCRHGYV